MTLSNVSHMTPDLFSGYSSRNLLPYFSPLFLISFPILLSILILYLPLLNQTNTTDSSSNFVLFLFFSSLLSFSVAICRQSFLLLFFFSFVSITSQVLTKEKRDLKKNPEGNIYKLNKII